MRSELDRESGMRSVKDGPVESRRRLRRATFCGAWALAILAVAMFAGCKRAESTGQKYHCPMHPTIISDRPGDCPICGMKLVPIKGANAPAAKTNAPAAAPNAKAGEYYCPMDLNVVSNGPGKCPECNMKLVLRTNDAGHVSSDHSDHTPPATATEVTGRAEVTVSADKQQLIGLRVSKVEKRELAATVRATGTLEHDERRMAKIAPRFGGWVRELKVNFTGQMVERGEPLLTVYSPELLSAENEYVLALGRVAQIKRTPELPQEERMGAGELESAQRLLDTARRRLLLWEIGEEEIRALEQTRQVNDELMIRAPVSGHVIAKTAVAGKAFMAGETLYEIADLTHIWVRAYVYEQDLPLIKEGQPAEVVLPYLENKTYPTKVSFIYPHIEQQTRRAEVRLEVDNPHHALRPGMWADVNLKASFGNVLAIPASAVIDTGTRCVAFVRQGEHLSPREVKIGARTEEYWQVLSGVAENDEVVTRALFLIDSESQLKAAIAGMESGSEHEHGQP